MTDRTNQEWLAELREPAEGGALSDLRSLLIRGLRHAMSDRPAVAEEDLEDFAQEAVLKVLTGLPSFRWESRFTTWAHKIAVHVAFTELRRRRWQDVSLEEITSAPDSDFIPERFADPAAGPEQLAVQEMVVRTLRQTIARDLTERQRQAMMAVLAGGMSLQETARRMGTNRNALYKVLHDARRRLKTNLLAKGLSAQDILAAFEPRGPE